MKVPSIYYRLPCFFFFLFLIPISLLIQVRANTGEKRNMYIVYMGAATKASSHVREDHVQLLDSVLERKEQVEKTLVHSYKHGFSGFSARLTNSEAGKIAEKPGVISVFADPILQLHTTRSWDFLQYQTGLETNPKPDSNSKSSSQESDTIIGILDTGIWPESESFNDKDMGPIPSRWKGQCMEGDDFTASNCNRKLIGARYYYDFLDSTPRDKRGHGTHTASTAAGSSVVGAAYYGLAEGTAKGGSPGSRIAMYKVCTLRGCSGSMILSGFDDAIGDGVDMISLSLGSRAGANDFSTDPIAIGAFHAVEKGITVICSAGNDGPSSETVSNASPWIFTVGATTIDRDFESDVVLGGKKVIKGEAINFSTLQKSPVYPLIDGESAKLKSSFEDDARKCNTSSLDVNKIKGKIVLCYHSKGDLYSKTKKMEFMKQCGGMGLILIDDLERAVSSTYVAFPVTVISQKEADGIFHYINSTRKPVATILPTVTVTKYKPAPVVAYFSSRGPSLRTRNILKPDITAPGVSILAAWIQTNDTSDTPKGHKPSHFNVISGTSMSCPHVSGIAATIKSKNPTWSPSAIRSAIMTTATQVNNEKTSITTDSGSKATPYDFGAGEIRPSRALEPGLVYETDTYDYLQFMCNYGYSLSIIKKIASVIPNGFDCPKNSSKELISNLNYPSIAISKFNGKETKTVIRTVTNVGTDDETTYAASIKSPTGLDVKVIPDKLQFTKNIKKLSFQMIFSSASSSSLKDDVFGSVIWSNEKYKVQSPIVVSSG